MQLGIGLVQDADDVHVPVVAALMVEAADDVHLGAAVFDGFGPAGDYLLVAHCVTLWVAQVGAKRTEDAAVDADVRRVEMCVDVVVREVAVLALADKIGELADFRQRRCGRLQHEAIFEREPLAGFDFVPDGFQDG